MTPDTPGATPGATTVTNADGSVTTTNPDGTVTTTKPDGTTTTTTPNPVTTTNPDYVAPTCSPGVPATSQLPRLTRAQYDRTIRDLVGLDTQPSSMLAPDSAGSVDQRAWDGYTKAAETLAPQILADAGARAKAIPCAPEGDGTACANQFIAEFGQRAFRRPLTPAETAKFQGLYANRAAITEGGTFDEVMEVLLRSFLQSPSFLTRAELQETMEGGYYALGDWEIASRLSYTIWGSMPDDTLFQAAAAGALNTPEQILEQAQRMVADPKARPMVAEFHEHYMKMGAGTRWDAETISRDTTKYPEFSEAAAPLMAQEIERLYDHLVFDLGATFQDLLTTQVAFVNSTNAPLYGLPAASHGAELAPVTLTDGARPGVFTRAGFLAAHANFDRTSPILRGAFLQKEVLCTVIPPPPPGVEGTALPTAGLATNRERVDAQTEADECAACHHTVINPTGFALEGFNAAGGIQALDNGVAVNTVADVPMGSAMVHVNDAVELMNAIADSPEAQECYARKWVQFAFDRLPNVNDQCLVNSMASKVAAGGYSVQNLIADLTTSESFRVRATEVGQ